MATKTLIQMKAEYVRLREVVDDPRFDDLPRKKRTHLVTEYLNLKRQIQLAERRILKYKNIGS